MSEIDKLVEVSRKYGRDDRYVIAGGGNTSYKNEERLWVKAFKTNRAYLLRRCFAAAQSAKNDTSPPFGVRYHFSPESPFLNHLRQRYPPY